MEKKELELCKKLQVLATKGIEGERENAEKLLARMMKKYGITAEELEGEAVQRYWAKVTKDYMRLAIQIGASVWGKERMTYSGTKSGRTHFVYDATLAEHIEFTEKFNFYLAKYKEEQKRLYSAFIMKNDLYAKVNEDEMRSYDELTDKEKEEYDKIERMSRGLDERTRYKTIEGAN